MNLEEKIKNGTTELQESYEVYLIERNRSLEKIRLFEKQMEEEKAKLKSICNSIRQCHDRAIEQGYPHLFR